MQIRLIALDLDFTTLDSVGNLPAKNRMALEKTIRNGIHVVVASGRCHSALPAEVTEIDGINYAISSNGANMKDLRDGSTIYAKQISPVAIKMLADIVKENDLEIEVFVDGAAYMERSVWQTIRDGGITYRRREYIMRTRNPVDGIVDFMLDHDLEVENVNIFFEDMERKPIIRQMIASLDGEATITTSFDHNWEVGALGTSKAAALEKLCEILELDMSEVMAFGDSPNDISMIKAAGIGVAVGNAKKEVKQAADYIGATNDECGVALAIEKFAFSE